MKFSVAPLLLVAVVLLVLLCGAQQQVSAATTVAQSTFAQSDEGWTYVDNMGQTGPVNYANSAISRADTSANSWWFYSAPFFSGSFTSAYNGQLSFTLSFLSYNNNNNGPIADADVVLVAACGYTLSKSNVVTPGSTGTYTVVLNEDGWIDSRTKRNPNVFDFLGVLNNLAGIQIRGGYFAGAETTQLSAVSVSSGTTWYPCCTITNDIDICTKPPSPFFNGPNLKFYCEGSEKKLITVTSINPRFGRRSGGTVLTITGTNFGFAGASSTVRVNGVPCQQSYHGTAAGSESFGVKGPAEETNIYCVTPYGEGTDLSVTVEAPSGPTDSPYNIRMNNGRTSWQSFETTSESCISEVNRGFSYVGHDWAWASQVVQTSTDTKTIAVDTNSGDVYIGGSTLAASTVIELGEAPRQQQKTIVCPLSTGCGYIAKFSSDGKVVWTAVVDMTAVAATSIKLTSIAVDVSAASKSVIYFTGYATVTASVQNIRIIGASSLSASQATATATTVVYVGAIGNDGTPVFINMLRRCSAGATWTTCTDAGSGTEKFTSTNGPKIAVYRPSTSYILNQQTKGDAPSNNYILGVPRDNGGVYLAFTILSAGSGAVTVAGGVDSSIYLATTDYATTSTIANGVSLNFLAKLDSSGNAQWVRGLGDITVTTTAPIVTDLVATNDAVYVSVAMTEASGAFTIKYDDCEWTTLTTGKGTANANCGASQQSIAASSTGGTVSFIAAYSAAGKLKWHSEPAGSAGSWTLKITALALVRPLSGDKAVDSSPHQLNVPNFADGFYLYAAGDYTATAPCTMLGKLLSFPATSVTNAAVFKLDASTGAAKWVSYWGIVTEVMNVNDIQVDPRTGAVFLAGSGQQQAAPTRGSCTATTCGIDPFDFNTNSRLSVPGCMADPRTGLTGINVGQSYCKFTPFTTAADTGFIIKFTDAILDSKNKVIASSPADVSSGSTARPSVHWMKTFGISTQGSSKVEALAISDTSVYAFGRNAAQAAGTSYSFPNLAFTFSNAASDVLAKLSE